MKTKTWKILFFASLLILVASNIFWFGVAIDYGLTINYQSMDLSAQEQTIKALGNLIVKGSKQYSKQDILHLLRQANKDAFIVEEDNNIIFENLVFEFKEGKLVNVKQ